MHRVPTCFRDELIFLGDSCKKFECDVRIYVFNIKKVCTELEINKTVHLMISHVAIPCSKITQIRT